MLADVASQLGSKFQTQYGHNTAAMREDVRQHLNALLVLQQQKIDDMASGRAPLPKYYADLVTIAGPTQGAAIVARFSTGEAGSPYTDSASCERKREEDRNAATRCAPVHEVLVVLPDPAVTPGRLELGLDQPLIWTRLIHSHAFGEMSALIDITCARDQSGTRLTIGTRRSLQITGFLRSQNSFPLGLSN